MGHPFSGKGILVQPGSAINPDKMVRADLLIGESFNFDLEGYPEGWSIHHNEKSKLYFKREGSRGTFRHPKLPGDFVMESAEMHVIESYLGLSDVLRSKRIWNKILLAALVVFIVSIGPARLYSRGIAAMAALIAGAISILVTEAFNRDEY